MSFHLKNIVPKLNAAIAQSTFLTKLDMSVLQMSCVPVVEKPRQDLMKMRIVVTALVPGKQALVPGKQEES